MADNADSGKLATESFGIVQAFLVPGLIALWGISYMSSAVRALFDTTTSQSGPTISGFLTLTLVCLAVGLTVSAVRWMTIEQIYHRIGVSPSAFNFANLPKRLAAFKEVVENHYRYYQFYANTLVAGMLAFSLRALRHHSWSSRLDWSVALVCGLALFLGGRDALSHYYERGRQILS